MGISAQQAKDLKTIAAMSEETISAISAAFDKSDGDLTDQAVIQGIIKPHFDLEVEELKSVSFAISGLLYAYIESERNEDDFIEQLVGSNNESDFSFNESELEGLKSNLLRLFRIVPLFVAHKAQTLVMESERLMTDVRILTDIRPIFHQLRVGNILGYAISQTLKIDYNDSRGAGEFYVALDSSDLHSFRETIDRALEKLEIIKSQSGISPKSFIRD